MKTIGIAGGSGSGKSSVSYALQDTLPDKIEILNIDDYQKLKNDPGLPMLDGMINWDHPDIINWENLIADVEMLKASQRVTLNSWAHRSNADYAKTRQMIVRTIEPKPIFIIEGCLALYNQKLNDLYDQKYYLDLDDTTRNFRRDKAEIIGLEAYEEKVLKPMFKQFVEPTKKNADEIIDVAGKSVEEIKNYLPSRII